ncbi:MAG: hypothetical protein ACI84C_000528 [Flavobacteriales bacterium]|jgi:hypothetical protein
MKIQHLLFFLILFPAFGQAQYEFHRYDEIDILVDGSPLKSAWAGGINSGQLSRIDLNNDGLEDLFIFDRIGNRILTFINEDGTSGQMKYRHEYEYVDNFPDSLKSWALLRDSNCDGSKDIYSGKNSSIMIHKNVGNDEPAFELTYALTSASYNLSGVPFDAPIYSISVDIPSIVDYEGDGDMDIITWTETGGTLYYYKNISIESGECETPLYQTANRCYGKLGEASESFDLFFGSDFECAFNVINPEFTDDGSRDGVHTGGTILSIDLDQNGIKDLVLSDVTETYFVAALLQEDPEDQLDEAFEVTPNFPEGYIDAEGVDMRIFPAGFYEDVNNDGVRDLIVSPNGTVDTEDDNSMILYLNNGVDDLPDFEKIEEDFLQKDMIDLGRNAHPVVLDYNGDGLMDLVVANKEYNQDVNEHPSQLALFINIGTTTEPEFEVVDFNWLDLPQYGVESVHPAFGDMDNDGDQDLILGEEGGIMHYFENTAGAGNPMEMTLTIPGMTYTDETAMDVGQFAAPQIFDLDEDGLLDLVVGERNGNVNYLRNTGTVENFAFELVNDSIGNALATNFLGIFGNSVPFLWHNQEGEIQMIMGTETGYISHFDNISGNLEGDFNLVTDEFAGIWEGTYSGAWMHDFTGDDTLDLVYGQIGGGLAFYKGGNIIIDVPEITEVINLGMFPNPTSGILNVIGLEQIASTKQLIILDHLGRQVMLTACNNGAQCTIDVSSLAGGLYILQATNKQGNVLGIGKFVMN